LTRSMQDRSRNKTRISFFFSLLLFQKKNQDLLRAWTVITFREARHSTALSRHILRQPAYGQRQLHPVNQSVVHSLCIYLEHFSIAHISIPSKAHGAWPMFWPVLRRCHILG
jgi:hypothetical protein